MLFRSADAPPAQGTTKVNAARAGQKMNINITIDNPSTVKITFELFSAMNNWTTQIKRDLVSSAMSGAGYTLIPALSTEGLGTVGVGTVGYDQEGDLNVYGAALANPATIGCGEYPYNSLVESTKVLPFRCTVASFAVETQGQLNNQLLHFTRTFAGGYTENRINVRAYKRPTQFQNLEVDTLAPFDITAETGLRYALEVGETVQISMFITKWAKPSL